MNTLIRERRDGDDERIAFVVRRAFGTEAEVQLVSDLRDEGAMALELVAEHGDEGVVGHIAYSRLDVRAGEQTANAVALAPLAVLPTLQRQGIGRALVMQSLEHLRQRGAEIAIVLGDPAYYSQFGFSALLARLLQAPYAGDAFQALELRAGALGRRPWRVAYADAFGTLS